MLHAQSSMNIKEEVNEGDKTEVLFSGLLLRRCLSDLTP